MLFDYNTSKRIAQRFYECSFSFWRSTGMNVYQAIKKAEQEVLNLQVNPFTGKGKIDSRACKDFVKEMQEGEVA